MVHKVKLSVAHCRRPAFLFRANLFSLALLISSLAVFGTLWFWESFPKRSGTYGWIGLLGIIAFGPTFNRLRQRRFDLAEPGVWFAAFYFVDFSANAFYDITFGSVWLNQDAAATDMRLINTALAVSTIGLISFWAGYSLSIGRLAARSLPLLPARWKPSRLLPVAIACLLVAWALRVYIITSHSGNLLAWVTGDKDRIIRLASGFFTYIRITYIAFGTAGIVLLFILIRKFSSFKSLWIFFAALPLELSFLFIEGKRICLPSLLFSLLIAGYMLSPRGHRISTQFLSLVLVILLIAVLLYPLVTMMRFGVEDPLETLLHSGRYHPVALFQMVGRNLHSLDSLAMVIQKVPSEIIFSYGTEITRMPYALIPRAIWPEKPIINPDDLFREQFVRKGLVAEGVAVSISLPGEFYWDGGIFGVCLGMGFFGILWKFLYTYLAKRVGNLSNCLITSVVFVWFFMILQQNVVNFTAHVYELVLLTMICLLVSETKRRPVFSERVFPLNEKWIQTKEIQQ